MQISSSAVAEQTTEDQNSAFAQSKWPACTFVVPCLNESLSLRRVVSGILAIRDHFENLEVLVVDNGSDDDSVQIATNSGARIFHCAQRGYGAAVRAGIFAAKNEFIVFLDGDCTYDPSDALKLLQTYFANSSDLVVGNRLRGKIEVGAMPALHRYFGTPSLSLLITSLYGLKRGARIGDCNGGMRAFKRSDFLKWSPESNGMDFASEMIVRAVLSGANYHEVPIQYRKAPVARISHLRTWRDGWKHLTQILRFLRPSITARTGR